jgi:hypothetical protein
MLLGDLANEGKAQARSSRACAARAIKRREDMLTLSRGDAIPAVTHRQYGVAALRVDTDFDRRRSMLLGIFNEVANHPLQQCRVAPHDDRLARDIAFPATFAFLRSER